MIFGILAVQAIYGLGGIWIGLEFGDRRRLLMGCAVMGAAFVTAAIVATH